MKKVYIAVMALVVAGTSISCSHKVTRIDPNEQVDLSGRWNNTDSRLVAEQMIDAILAKYPQHKRVLFFRSKFENNEPLTSTEISELQKFSRLLIEKEKS